MVEIILQARNNNSKAVLIWKDVSVFESDGIVVDTSVFNTGSFLDRDYDIRSFVGFSVLLSNLGANAVDYIILGTTKDFPTAQMDSTLVDADFTETLVPVTVIEPGAASALYELVKESPGITGVKVRVQETIESNDSLVQGNIRAF